MGILCTYFKKRYGLSEGNATEKGLQIDAQVRLLHPWIEMVGYLLTCLV